MNFKGACPLVLPTTTLTISLNLLYREKRNMIRIAIVEDEKTSSDLIEDYLATFGKKEGEEFSVKVFRDAVSFLENYKPEFDLVFMDIMMPAIDGMRAAHKLREMDNFVLLIFITNMGDYAVKGYDVGAIAFIKKPVSYADFEGKLRRAVFTIKSRDDKYLIVSSGGNRYRVMIRDLIYIEVSGHVCTYHTSEGDIEGRNTLSALAKELEKFDFMACSSCYLINPIYIKRINVHTVNVGGIELEISRLKKKTFLLQFNEWLAKGGNSL